MHTLYRWICKNSVPPTGSYERRSVVLILFLQSRVTRYQGSKDTVGYQTLVWFSEGRNKTGVGKAGEMLQSCKRTCWAWYFQHLEGRDRRIGSLGLARQPLYPTSKLHVHWETISNNMVSNGWKRFIWSPHTWVCNPVHIDITNTCTAHSNATFRRRKGEEEVEGRLDGWIVKNESFITYLSQASEVSPWTSDIWEATVEEGAERTEVSGANEGQETP